MCLSCHATVSEGANVEPRVIATVVSPKMSSAASLRPLAVFLSMLLSGAASSASLDGMQWRISLHCWGIGNCAGGSWSS